MKISEYASNCCARECARCRIHDIKQKLKGHKNCCPYKACICLKCQIYVCRRKSSASSAALRRVYSRELNVGHANSSYAPLADDARNQDNYLLPVNLLSPVASWILNSCNSNVVLALDVAKQAVSQLCCMTHGLDSTCRVCQLLKMVEVSEAVSTTPQHLMFPPPKHSVSSSIPCSYFPSSAAAGSYSNRSHQPSGSAVLVSSSTSMSELDVPENLSVKGQNYGATSSIAALIDAAASSADSPSAGSPEYTSLLNAIGICDNQSYSNLTPLAPPTSWAV